ncbi:uncharacterized protein M6B38_413800 [Iris pallida]|uniref:Uncharacterized protein n=1 Tax=Iris pallida TaxID=29817 RepID=A0AAX6FKU9_IRIPA|nr:uncharacterized protein M6B38_413800 [Iris pallida]
MSYWWWLDSPVSMVDGRPVIRQNRRWRRWSRSGDEVGEVRFGGGVWQLRSAT